MAIFHISVVNQHFEARNKHDLPSIADARAEALKSALQIGIDEVDEENPLFGAEVSILQDGERVTRFILSIAISELR